MKPERGRGSARTVHSSIRKSRRQRFVSVAPKGRFSPAEALDFGPDFAARFLAFDPAGESALEPAELFFARDASTAVGPDEGSGTPRRLFRPSSEPFILR